MLKMQTRRRAMLHSTHTNVGEADARRHIRVLSMRGSRMSEEADPRSARRRTLPGITLRSQPAKTNDTFSFFQMGVSMQLRLPVQVPRPMPTNRTRTRVVLH